MDTKIDGNKYDIADLKTRVNEDGSDNKNGVRKSD